LKHDRRGPYKIPDPQSSPKNHMKISQRAQSVDPFFAMEFGKRAAALEAQGHQVIKLSLGEPDFGPPPAVLAAARTAVEGGSLPYTAALGMPALREAIAGFYLREHGIVLSPNRIIVTAGASAALLLVTAALVDQGDEVIVGDPSYPCNRQFLSSFGANVKLVATDALDGGHERADDRHALEPDRHLGAARGAARDLRLGARARRLAHRRRDLPEPGRPKRGWQAAADGARL
jgi:DNA-binding transcriptional MocR family regulator